MILPAVDDRPLVMKRFPNGIVQVGFLPAAASGSRAAGRATGSPARRRRADRRGRTARRLIGGSLTTLLYMTQLAAISQDPWFSRVADPFHADYVAIDLDPGDGATFDKVLDVARWTKDVLDKYRIPAWPKTSGVQRTAHLHSAAARDDVRHGSAAVPDGRDRRRAGASEGRDHRALGQTPAARHRVRRLSPEHPRARRSRRRTPRAPATTPACPHR